MTRRVVRTCALIFTAFLALVVLSLGRSADARFENLASDKPVSASASQNQSFAPRMANDGDPASRWCAPDNGDGYWWQVELGKPEALTGCRIDWEHEAHYRYKVEDSADGNVWSVLTDQTATDARSQERRHGFKAEGVRHVRLTVTGVEPGHWASVREFEVFGTRPAKATTAKAKPKRDDRRLLWEVEAPPGFKVTLFAAPPNAGYPTCLAAAPTGEVFVGVDENGSLDAGPERGRVMRCVDMDGNGTADTFTVFARMDSPRGLTYDASTRTLYVQHPPFITAHRDDDGDGVADHEEVLVKARRDDPDPAVRLAATDAARALGLGGPDRGPAIATLPFERVLAAVVKQKGDPELGGLLFQRQGCVSCHTVGKAEGLKGPYLGDIANRYSRAELTESILKPSAKIAQGFETQKFATVNGQSLEGFVARESGVEVEIRNASGAATVIPKAEIEERGKSELSVMPNGLVDPLTVHDLASILDYLESLKAKGVQ
jgi:putative heme-binding domain-containing protein